MKRRSRGNAFAEVFSVLGGYAMLTEKVRVAELVQLAMATRMTNGNGGSQRWGVKRSENVYE